jgi:hypothetical protein
VIFSSVWLVEKGVVQRAGLLSTALRNARDQQLAHRAHHSLRLGSIHRASRARAAAAPVKHTPEVMEQLARFPSVAPVPDVPSSGGVPLHGR